VKKQLLIFILFQFVFLLSAQDKEFARSIIDTLSSPSMHGRGYVNNGDGIAANLISSQFEKFQLKKFSDDYSNHNLNTKNTIKFREYLENGFSQYMSKLKPRVQNEYISNLLPNLRQCLDQFDIQGNYFRLISIIFYIVMCLNEIYIFAPDQRKILTQLNTNRYTVNKTVTLLLESKFLLCYKSNCRMVPFITKTGAFGFNTFLYLFYYNIYPLGSAETFNPSVHTGTIVGSCGIYTHDYLHYYNRYAKLEGTPVYKKAYIMAMTDFKNGKLNDLKLKQILFILFYLINELGFQLTGNEETNITSILTETDRRSPIDSTIAQMRANIGFSVDDSSGDQMIYNMLAIETDDLMNALADAGVLEKSKIDKFKTTYNYICINKEFRKAIRKLMKILIAYLDKNNLRLST